MLAPASATLLAFPLDTIKTMAQANNITAMGAFTLLVRRRPSSLYRGMAPALAETALVDALFFGPYGSTRSTPDAPLVVWGNVALTSIMLCAVVTPLHNIKTSAQVKNTTVKQLWRRGGLCGFYRGWPLVLAWEGA